MDDDDEDYQALFFTECQELLAELQEQLAQLDAGTGDTETVNAAFRAVHSVKGGAAAFEFTTLIGFAHAFETVMDRIRSDDLALSGNLTALLLRAGDVMEQLIEFAQSESDSKPEAMDRVLEELTALSGSDNAPAPKEVQAEPDGPTPAPPPARAEVAEDLPREVTVTIAPGPDFRASGHDLLQLVKAAGPLGLTHTKVEGEIPLLPKFDPDEWELSWVLTFSTKADPSEFEVLLEFYEMAAEIVVDDPLHATSEAEAEVAVPDMPDVPAPQPALPPDTPEVASPETATAASTSRDPSPAKESGPKVAPVKSLRVDLNRIDRLVNLVGEMLITQAGLAQSFADVEDTGLSDVAQSVDVLSRQLRELQESVMAIRAQPVKSVFSRMPRVVRDLSDKLGKRARLVLSGEHTEVDTTVIEELSEPLMHMLRNSMDHGLEDHAGRIEAGKDPVGTIELKAEHRGERVIISLSDDGRGIDRKRVLEKAIQRGLLAEDDPIAPEDIDQLIFHPGFSTAQNVSAVSGRGVGMDVVKKKLQALGGRCTLNNRPGKGAEFLITLPLTLAVMDGMTIKSAGQQFILPLSSVVEAVKLDSCQIRQLPDRSKLLERRGDYLRMLNLSEVLNLDKNQANADMAIVVDTEVDGLIALQVDDLIGQRQIVLKSLEANYHQVDGVSGATILGDGHVALILDIPALLQMGNPLHAVQETLH